jgi:hypothetical protein
MRTFNCEPSLDKSTDNKLRWLENVDGVKFKMYIPKSRVPNPTPRMIAVDIYDATSIPDSRLSVLGNTAERKRVLQDVGAHLDYTTESGQPIVAALRWYSDHTQTVRYQPFGDQTDWEIGEPYIPISELGDTYPKRIVLVVRFPGKLL